MSLSTFFEKEITMNSTTPPLLSGGIPVLGHALEMMRNREELFRRGFAEHGDIFTIKLGPQYAAVVSGAEYNKIVYTQTDRSLNMQEAYTFLKASIGEVLFTASKETYYNQRPVLQEVFRRERMVQYIQSMNIEVQRWLDGLGESGEMNLTAEMLRLTQFVAGRALIGPDYERELGPDFWVLYGDISRSLDPLLPPHWPLPKFKRRDNARAGIRKVFRGVLDERRAHPERYDDLITTLLQTPLKDGSQLDDESIVSIFTGLLFAGHETTAGQAAWLVTLLLQHPETLARAQAEVDHVLQTGESIDLEKINLLHYIAWAIDETTRIRPSADIQMRTVEDPLTLGSFDLPKGWRVIVNAANSHFLPEVFTDPQRFDPLRWSPERGEGKNPFSIVGFGGGVHKCTGMNFAKNEMAIITALLLRQFELELKSNEVRIVYGNGANHPSEVKVGYRRKNRID
jgi:sterol 14alpha-demethylase